MKIVLCSALYPPFVRGGAEHIVRLWASMLMEDGHTVTVISTVPGSGWSRRTNIDMMPSGERVIRFGAPNLCHYLALDRVPWFVRLVWRVIDHWNILAESRLAKVLRDEKPDVVITHNYLGMGGYTPRIIAKLRLPHIHMVHDVQYVIPSGNLLFSQEDSLYNRMIRFTGYARNMDKRLSSVRTFVYPSTFLRSFYERNGMFQYGSSTVIHAPSEDVTDNCDHVAQIPLSLLYVGSLRTEKGILTLCKAIKNAPSLNISLSVIGSGPAKNEIMRQAAHDPRIRLIGKVPHEMLSAHYRAADVVVIPSLCYDAFPTVAIEALSFGVPVLATRSGGIEEIVHDGVNGWLVDVFEPTDSIEKLEQLTREPANVDACASKARESISSLSPGAIAAQVQATVRAVVPSSVA